MIMEKYEELVLEVIAFDSEDVIVTSNGDSTNYNPQIEGPQI